MEYVDLLGKKCAAYNCRSTEYNLINGYRVSSGVQFFSLLVNEKARVKWSRVIERPNEKNKYRASLKTILCEKHFAERQGYNQMRDANIRKKVLKPNNVTWSDLTTEQNSKTPTLRELVEKRIERKKKAAPIDASRTYYEDEKLPYHLVRNGNKLTRSKSLPLIEMRVKSSDEESLVMNTSVISKHSIIEKEKEVLKGIAKEKQTENHKSHKSINKSIVLGDSPEHVDKKVIPKLTLLEQGILSKQNESPGREPGYGPGYEPGYKVHSYMETNSEQRADTQFKKLKTELDRSKKECEELHRQIYSSELSLVKHIKGSDRPCHYYTGFSTLKQLYNVFEDIKCQHWENINFYHNQMYMMNSGERKLSPFDGYILTLVRLKRNFSVIHLAFLFEVSESTVSVVLRTWIDFLYKYDSSMWPSSAQLNGIIDSLQDQSIQEKDHT